VEEVLGIYRCMTVEPMAYRFEEPFQSIRNRMQRMYKHGFCRLYNLGIRPLVYTPQRLSWGQNPYLLADLMGSRFRVTLTLATRQYLDWGFTWTPGWEAAQAAVRVRSLLKRVAAGETFSLLGFVAGPEARVVVSAIVGTCVALLSRKPAQERRKRALIEAYAPLLNAFRELVVSYPVDALPEEVRDLVAMRISRLAELMYRLGTELLVRAECFPGTPEELIEHSRRRLGKILGAFRSTNVSAA
jgi:hypothetical protein